MTWVVTLIATVKQAWQTGGVYWSRSEELAKTNGSLPQAWRPNRKKKQKTGGPTCQTRKMYEDLKVKQIPLKENVQLRARLSRVLGT